MTSLSMLVLPQMRDIDLNGDATSVVIAVTLLSNGI